MDIQLSIRHNLPSGDDLFAPARVVRFDPGRAVSVGADAACDCPIDDPATFAPRHFDVVPKRRGSGWTLQVRGEEGETGETYVNGKRAERETPLNSGDEIRVGHWTLLFHKIPSPGEYRVRRDMASRVTPVLLSAAVIAELVLIAWLPYRLQASSLWEAGRLRQETALAADALRAELRRAEAESGSMAEAAYELLGREMRALADYLHEHGRRLPKDEWQAVRATVSEYRKIKERVDLGLVVQPLPELTVDRAVQAAMRAGRQQPSPLRKNE